jgi:hypothetical protein
MPVVLGGIDWWLDHRKQWLEGVPEEMYKAMCQYRGQPEKLQIAIKNILNRYQIQEDSSAHKEVYEEALAKFQKETQQKN